MAYQPMDLIAYLVLLFLFVFLKLGDFDGE